MRPALALLALVAAGTVQAQTPAAPPAPPAAAVPDFHAVDPQNTLIFETTKGRIVIELRPEIAPLHVARMKALTRLGKLNNQPFYRVIKGFMAQGGNIKVVSGLPDLKHEFEFTKTAAMPYLAIAPSTAGELGYIGSMPVIIDPDGVKGHVRWCPGVAALAHGVDKPDSANSQFFLMRVPGPSLEKQYSVWGRVIVGQSVVETIKDGEPVVDPDILTRARVLADIPAAQRPDIQVMDTRSAAFREAYDATAKVKGAQFDFCDVTVPVKAS